MPISLSLSLSLSLFLARLWKKYDPRLGEILQPEESRARDASVSNFQINPWNFSARGRFRFSGKHAN